MQPGYESLRGLDRDRLVSVVEPVLRAHGVEPVELIWRSDPRGWLLYLTVERPGTSEPGLGVTLDLCADISRDLSAALDVAEVIQARYRLEVGSPGVDRALYGIGDYARFAGQLAKVKLKRPGRDETARPGVAPAGAGPGGQRVLRGILKGVEDGRIVLECDGEEHRLLPEQIESGRLAFDWQASRGEKKGPRGAKGRRPSGSRNERAEHGSRGTGDR
jgi:ribosome maturation factor RimP